MAARRAPGDHSQLLQVLFPGLMASSVTRMHSENSFAGPARLETLPCAGSGSRRWCLPAQHDQLVPCWWEPTHGRGFSSSLRAALHSQLALFALVSLPSVGR